MSENTYHHGDLKNALIQAGVEILVKEGIGGLSLRKVALRAGVSHSAPYAHFADKQALIAAISTEGFSRLYNQLQGAVSQHSGDSRRQLLAAAQAYTSFAMSNPDIFKIMFSSALEKEKEYPAFVEVSQQTFALVLEIVRACQLAGLLQPGAADVLAVSIWGQVYGVVSLALEGQLPHTLLGRHTLPELVTLSIEQQLSAGRR